MPEDFRSALVAVSGSDSEDEASRLEGSDTMMENDELVQLQTVTYVPGPDADTNELRKSLGLAQLAFTQVQAELNELRKQYNALTAKLPARTRTCALKASSSPLNNNITQVVKKYCVFYHLWVPENLFPVDPQTNVDL
ncbi:hypothetical protein BDN67DRAFT_1014536 [Paxillus ammoniavirescens]|nr:hypothetical protein BDN67DRAFT_1014536 [Paxillus ammoniavirescens]